MVVLAWLLSHSQPCRETVHVVSQFFYADVVGCGIVCLQVLFVFETSEEINLVMVASLEFCRSIEGL